MTEFKIPLRNKKKVIVGYATVNKEHYEELNNYKWSKNKGGYAIGTIKKRTYLMHRYIKGIIMKENIENKIIDHKDQNKLNNMEKNLEYSTPSENSRNKGKKQNTSSKYVGVSIFKKIWEASISIEGVKIRAFYENEIHAAWQYNLWLNEYKLAEHLKNDIKEPKDFIKWKSILDDREFPSNIHKVKEGFKVIMMGKTIGIYKELKEAEEAKDIEKQNQKNLKIEEKKKKFPLQEMKILTTNGIEVFYYFVVKKEEEDFKVIIDKDKYDDVIRYNWNINPNNYVISNKIIMNGKERKYIRLHRYIKNYDGKKNIDHINKNPLDNRDCNLRIGTQQENCQNKSKNKNSLNDHVGIVKSGSMYTASMNFESKHVLRKSFANELDAIIYKDKFILANKELSFTPLILKPQDYKIQNNYILYKDELENDLNKLEIFKMSEIIPHINKKSKYIGITYDDEKKFYSSNLENKKIKVFSKQYLTELEAVIQRDVFILNNKEIFSIDEHDKNAYKKKLNFLEGDYKIVNKYVIYKSGTNEMKKFKISNPILKPQTKTNKHIGISQKNKKFDARIEYKNDGISFRKTFDTELEAIQQRDIYILNNKNKFPKKDEYKKKLNLSEDNYILNSNNEYTIKPSEILS